MQPINAKYNAISFFNPKLQILSVPIFVSWCLRIICLFFVLHEFSGLELNNFRIS